MTVLELALIGVAGLAAGFVNAVAGSGTLITFPTLLAFGVPPVTANVSNNVGLVPGALSSALAGRRELTGQRSRALRLATGSALGGVLGAVLLLVLPATTFDAVVPVLVALGLLLVAFQPLITRRVAAAHSDSDDAPSDRWWLWPATSLTGVYGGYFGAAQGILLVAVLGVGTHDSLHRNNALKNVLAGIVNAVAAVVFIAVADVDWVIVTLIAFGSVVGAQLGVHAGRRMPAALLRAFIVTVGLVALTVFLTR